MVGSIERIEQEITELDTAVVALAEEFYNAYASYLNGLGKAVHQQLILASYHVCTQGYPEQFLQLPYTQRQQLQQTLRQLAHQIQEELLAQLHKPMPMQEPEIDREDANQEDDGFELLSLHPQPDQSENSLVGSGNHSLRRSLTPADLAEWQEELEQAILQELRTASHAANRLLQQFGILSHKLPEPVLDTVAKAEAAEMGGNPPNLLNLLVEAVNNQDSEQSNQPSPRELKGQSVMHILAIHLRLAEIEFADASLNPIRTRIRSLVNQLKTLGREYHKKHRERAIAQAQAVWRATWTEE
jgi:hypothetical protein